MSPSSFILDQSKVFAPKSLLTMAKNRAKVAKVVIAFSHSKSAISGAKQAFDLNLIEASKDLGLNRIKTFFKVILPLSIPGIVAGSLLVFIPVVGEFIIPEMLGGSDRLYYGKILWEEFFVNRNCPGASALAFSGIIILVLPIVIFQILYSRWSQKNEI